MVISNIRAADIKKSLAKLNQQAINGEINNDDRQADADAIYAKIFNEAAEVQVILAKHFEKDSQRMLNSLKNVPFYKMVGMTVFIPNGNMEVISKEIEIANSILGPKATPETKALATKFGKMSPRRKKSKLAVLRTYKKIGRKFK